MTKEKQVEYHIKLLQYETWFGSTGHKQGNVQTNDYWLVLGILKAI